MRTHSVIMSFGLQPYPAYKNPGIAWLSEVPGVLGVRRLKNWVEMNQVTLPENTSPDYTADAHLRRNPRRHPGAGTGDREVVG